MKPDPNILARTLQEHRDDSSVLEGPESANVQQRPPSISATAAPKDEDDEELLVKRQVFDETVYPKIPTESYPDMVAEISVKFEESPPSIYSPPPGSESPSRSSLVIGATEVPKLQQPPPQRKHGALSTEFISTSTPDSYQSSRFDRNEAWDVSKDRKVVAHYSLLPLQSSSPRKRQRGRPSAIRYKKMTLEPYKALMAPVTAKTSLRQNIRDGFDEEETFLSGKQYSTKRRKRSPPPLGIGSLSVTVGPKSMIPRKATKRTGIYKRFVIDPDLDPGSKTKRQLEEADAEADLSATPNRARQLDNHIIPSIEMSPTRNNLEKPVVLPSLRAHSTIHQTGGPRHDFGKLDTSLSFLSDDTYSTPGVLCGSCSRPETTGSNAFETSHDGLQLWASSISRALSKTNQLSGSRGSSNNNDDTPNRSRAGTNFSNTDTRDTATNPPT
ncbi:hypothetical protein CT0861_05417 [Colletotrichum tofieldiae]|uniref:Uncharacterized protein n=1 Tax=Colletotrichum tofieldiae TaxID=708197 RepID=A0A161YD08_9PEZI|nr:hypothetical protein CT0861_05417 [Colletotrichum tofieldiae]